MKIILFIHILLISACVSAEKRGTTASAIRKTSSFNYYQQDSWLKKACPFDQTQAAAIFNLTLQPKDIISVSFDHPYFVGRLIFKTSYTKPPVAGVVSDYAIKKCESRMSAQSFIEWLAETKICGLSNAEMFFYTFAAGIDSVIEKADPGIKIITSKEDQKFYYLETTNGVYKVGKVKD